MSNEQPCCQECGGDLGPVKPNHPHKRFCSAACRKAFNNYRAIVGAQMFDYIMASRYARNTHAGALTTIAQIAMAVNERDQKQRNGRRSWIAPDLSKDPAILSKGN